MTRGQSITPICRLAGFAALALLLAPLSARAEQSAVLRPEQMEPATSGPINILPDAVNRQAGPARPAGPATPPPAAKPAKPSNAVAGGKPHPKTQARGAAPAVQPGLAPAQVARPSPDQAKPAAQAQPAPPPAAGQPAAPTQAPVAAAAAPAAKPVQAAEPAAEAASAAVARDAKAAQYCANIADAAADARYAWQAKQLAELEAKINERIKLLEAKRAEYEAWLRRRDEFLKKADESVVAVYSRMRPDAAAQQLAAMDDETAAAVLVKLNPRTAGAILNEMEPGRAAQLTHTMAGMPKKPADAEKSG